MGDWTTGRGFVSDSSRSVSPALIARQEYEAEMRAKKETPKSKRGKRWKPGDGSPPTDPGYRLTDRMERIRDEVARIRAEMAVWEAAMPRNRHERRKRAAILRDLAREIDKLPTS